MNIAVSTSEDHMQTMMTLHLNNLRTFSAQAKFNLEKYKEYVQPFYEEEEVTTSYLGKRFTDSFREAFGKNCTRLQTFTALAKTSAEKVTAFERWMEIKPEERQHIIIVQRVIDDLSEIRTAAHDALFTTERGFQEGNVRYDHVVTRYVTARTKKLAAHIKSLEMELKGQTYQKYIISGEETEAFISVFSL